MRNKKIGTSLLAIGFVIWGFSVASTVQSAFDANESLTTGAPQQQVAATWAVKDAAISGLQMLAVLGGLVIASLTVLTRRGSEEEKEVRLESGEWQRCPLCHDVVPAAASVCRSCTRELPVPVSDSPGVPPPVANDERDSTRPAQRFGPIERSDSYPPGQSDSPPGPDASPPASDSPSNQQPSIAGIGFGRIGLGLAVVGVVVVIIMRLVGGDGGTSVEPHGTTTTTTTVESTRDPADGKYVIPGAGN